MSLLTLSKAVEKRTTGRGSEVLKEKIPTNIEEFASLITIRSGNKLVPFQLYKHQKELLNLIEKHRGVVGVKSRQMGATQAIILRFLHKAALNPAYSALVFSKSKEDTSKVAYRCREMVRSLDGLIEFENDNLQTQRIVGGGVIHFCTSKIDGARGIDSVSDILYDEAAFPKEIEQLYGATEATQAMVGEEARTIVLSTPNGRSGWFFELANGSNPEEYDLMETIQRVRNKEEESILTWEDEDGWGKYIAHWPSHPIYGANPDYLHEIARKRKIPMSQVQQEYDLDFASAVTKPFSYELVKSFLHGRWTRAKKDNCEYYITIDCQFGGADYFVCLVVEHDLITNTFRIVDMYRKNHQRKSYHKRKVKELVEKYNPEKIAIEQNGGGEVYVEEIEDEYVSIPVVRICTTQGRKHGFLSKLLILMEDETMSAPKDKNIKEELEAFENKDGKLEGAEGKHDDIVMALLFQMGIIPTIERKTGLDLSRVRKYGN